MTEREGLLREAIAEEQQILTDLLRATDEDWLDTQPDWRKAMARSGSVTRIGDIRTSQASIKDMKAELVSIR